MSESASNFAAAQGADLPTRVRKSRLLPVVVPAVLVATLIAISAVVYARLTNGASNWMLQSDHVSDEEVRQRQEAFAALGRLQLRLIQPAEMSVAVEGMGLTPESKKLLLADTGMATAQSADPLLEPRGAAAPGAGEIKPTATNQPLIAPTRSVRLAWITLWDTDVEDGDVVRIESQGYARTITLSKRGDTFAVPVPSDGIVTVTGIKDGDGGGITVGVASGSTKAIFPIMSTGQSLGLRVGFE